MITLVVTGDFHGEEVFRQITGPKAILKTNRQYDIQIDIRPNKWSVYISQDGHEIDLQTVGNVYIRRPIPPQPDANIPDHAQEFAVRETFEIIGMFAAYCSYKQNGHLYCNGKQFNLGRNKIIQLIAASEAGIQIPETCITNIPSMAAKFYNEFQGNIIYKCLSTPVIQYADGKRSMIHTTFVKDSDFSSVKTCPCLFQRNIEKKSELRVAVIGDRIIEVLIDSQKTDLSKQDWRMNMSDESMYSKASISSIAGRNLIQLNRILNLDWSMMDLIISEDDAYIFLEANPDGAWLWLEDVLPTLDITQCVANYITTHKTISEGRR